MHHSISDLTRNADSLCATWSGGAQTDLPYLWLRDNCGCGECRVEQTTEKRFHLFRVPKDLRPLKVGIECAGSKDEAIFIEWPDGHHTRYRSSEVHGFLSSLASTCTTGMAGSDRRDSTISVSWRATAPQQS